MIIQESRYRRLFESARDGILILDAGTGRIIDANPFLIELLGLSREQLLGKQVWEIGTFQDIFASEAKFKELTKVGYVRFDNLPLQTVDGRNVQVEFVSNIYLEGQNQVIQCNIRDITERHRTSEASREKEQLSEAQRLGHVGSWFMKMAGPISWSQEMYCIYGVSPDTFTPTMEALLGLIHPDDRAKMQSWIAACAAGEGPGELEYRINRADGSTRFLLGRGEMVRDAEHRPDHMAGTAQDITERKKADRDRFRLAAIVDQTSDAIIGTNIQGIITSWNRGAQKLFGYASDEMVGKPITLLAPNGDSTRMDEHRSMVLQGKSIDYEAKRLTKDGREIDVWAAISPIKGTAGEILGVSGIYRNITARKRVEAELERLTTAIEQTGDVILITDSGGTILYVNAAFEATTGYSRQEALGRTTNILKSGKQDEAFYRSLWKTISSGRTWKGRMVNKRKDGSLYTADGTISPVRDSNGQIVNYVAVKQDVSERIRLESELLQAQKMESVGRLAGGVAHDFNNLLTAINGYAGFLLEALDQDDPKRADVKEILNAGERAAGLTRQLLAFSRKQILHPEVLDIHTAVEATRKMLKRLIGEDITLETRLAAHPCLVKVDAGQIDQVLLNLAVNARDAMPKGGTLAFETRVMTADADFASRHPDLPRGPLVCLSVRDSGCGMSEEVRARLFEPFFTTKERGQGTGLGLSMVFGIVKQSGGDIEVESAPGRGTTFRIYLPQVDSPAQVASARKDESTDVVLRGKETVLFVEDEETVLNLAKRSLTGSGYTVLTAADGPQALAELERHGRPVDLLVTDVVMPGMSGRDLARQIALKNMARRTLFISGYTDDAIVRHGVLEPGLAFLYKPFSPRALLEKLREVLDGPADKAQA